MKERKEFVERVAPQLLSALISSSNNPGFDRILKLNADQSIQLAELLFDKINGIVGKEPDDAQD